MSDGSEFCMESDQLFQIVMGIFIFLNQPGFALLEAGSINKKNVASILFKNIIATVITALCYFFVGFAFSYGSSSTNVFIGSKYFLLVNMNECLYAFWFLQYTFASTAATIISGAICERTKIGAYFLFTVFFSSFIYPVVVYWSWDEEGWLARRPFKDFAGSMVVHGCGGTAAFIAALMIGPREGRFGRDGSVHPMPSHSIPLMFTGALLILTGCLAFNASGQLKIVGASSSQQSNAVLVGLAVVNTLLASCASGVSAVFVFRAYFRRFPPRRAANWNIATALNGLIAGAVAICAGAALVKPWASILIGLVAGVVFVAFSEFVIFLRVDDPLNATALHFGCGLWGIIAAPLFNYQDGVFYKSDTESGKYFGWNILGAFAIITWTAVLTVTILYVFKRLNYLRVERRTEILGMDIVDHGEQSYSIIDSLTLEPRPYLPNPLTDMNGLNGLPSCTTHDLYHHHTHHSTQPEGLTHSHDSASQEENSNITKPIPASSSSLRSSFYRNTTRV